MNIRDDSIIRAPTGKEDTCVKFVIDSTDEPFVFHDIAESGQQYTLSFYAKSEGAGGITGGSIAMETGTDWKRYVVTFVADSADVPVYFTVPGTYYLYNTQLEIGCKDTDFALNPADTEEDVDKLAVTVENHSTRISILDGEISLKVSTSEFEAYQSETERHLTEVSQQLTKDSIIATVGNYYAYQSDLTSAEDRITEAETTIAQHANEISLMVAKDDVIGAINLTSEEAKISFEKITLEGATIADAFTCTNLTVTGDSVFEGVLKGATGSFSGSVTASSGKIGNWFINNSRITTSETIYIGAKEAGMLLINEADKPCIFVQDANGKTQFSLARDGLLTANNTNITGAITATSITAKNEYYIHASSGTGIKARALYAADGAIGNTLQVGDGFSALHLCGLLVSKEAGLVSCGEDGSWGLMAGKLTAGNTVYNDGSIELSGATPFIDFHFNNSSENFTSRIIEESSGLLRFSGAVTVSGALTFPDWGGGSRRPVGSMGTDGNRTAYISSKVNDSGTYYLTVNGQYGTAGSTYSSHNINCTTSDIRLKSNIIDTDVTALSIINQMQLRQFDWIENGIHQKIGFVADELELLDPALAIGGGYDEDGNMDVKSVNEFYLAGYLTKGIQELYTVQTKQEGELFTHKSQIEYLLDENAALKKRVKELEKAIA